MIENKIVISVSGGNVNGVFTNNPHTKVYLVDYDNLESDLNDDCVQSFPIDKIDKFRALVRKNTQAFPGITKLLERLNE